MQNLYYTSQDVQELLGVSRSKAYKIIRALNEELADRGYLVTAGKVPRKFLAEKFYGMT